jgi:hypothetical protein
MAGRNCSATGCGSRRRRRNGDGERDGEHDGEHKKLHPQLSLIFTVTS